MMIADNYILESIGLRRSHADLFSSGMAQGKGGMKLTYKVESFIPEEESDRKRFDLMVSVEVQVEGFEAETERQAFKVEATHWGGFKATNGAKACDDDHELAMCLAKQVLPVSREHANNLIALMGFRGAYLPWSFGSGNLAPSKQEPASK